MPPSECPMNIRGLCALVCSPWININHHLGVNASTYFIITNRVYRFQELGAVVLDVVFVDTVLNGGLVSVR